MTRPPMSHTAERLYEAVRPLAADDERYGWPLAHLVRAASLTLDEPADLSRDQDDGTPGWAVLFQLDRVPAKYLPFVGQFVGVGGLGDLAPDDQRERIRLTDGFRRGTPAAIQAAPLPWLSGTRTVLMTERHGSAYRVTVATFAAETVDADAVRRAVLAQVPAGIVCNVSVVPGGDFLTLRDTHRDFDELLDVYASFAEVREDPARQPE